MAAHSPSLLHLWFVLALTQLAPALLAELASTAALRAALLPMAVQWA